MQTKKLSSKIFKVLIGQTKPIYKKVQENIDRIKVSLQKYSESDQLDVLIFPEMALTGYTFKDREDIQPFIEKAGEGTTFKFCSELAVQLKAYVICGYPEVDNDQYYNSAIMVDREGKFLINHRKKHLYETDKPWASEGQNFTSITIKNKKNQDIIVAIAICMDINPYEYIDNSKFELATFCKEKKIDALLFLSAWNDHEPNNNSDTACDGIMNYWLSRLNPLINKKENSEQYEKSWIFICADRVGSEQNLTKPGETTFIGCSCVIKVNPLELMHFLKKKNEGYLQCEINI